MLRIKEIMTEQGISVSDFASKLGIRRETLYRQINGGNITIEKLNDFAKILNVKPYELFQDFEDDFQQIQKDSKAHIKCPYCNSTLKIKIE